MYSHGEMDFTDIVSRTAHIKIITDRALYKDTPSRARQRYHRHGIVLRVWTTSSRHIITSIGYLREVTRKRWTAIKLGRRRTGNKS